MLPFFRITTVKSLTITLHKLTNFGCYYYVNFEKTFYNDHETVLSHFPTLVTCFLEFFKVPIGCQVFISQ